MADDGEGPMTKGAKLRRLMSFVCFDEQSLQNGFLQKLVSAFEVWMNDRHRLDIYSLERSIRDKEPDCNEKGNFAHWKKSRARYAWCILLHAASGWFHSRPTDSDSWPHYLDAMRGILTGKPPVTKHPLNQYATLVGGYADDETDAFLAVYERVREMTDEMFMSDAVTKDALMKLGQDDVHVSLSDDGDDSSDGHYDGGDSDAEETSDMDESSAQ